MKTLAFLLLTSFSLHAAAQDYVLAEDRLSSGSLTLNGKQFSVETISRNGNVCEYGGTIKNPAATAGVFPLKEAARKI